MLSPCHLRDALYSSHNKLVGAGQGKPHSSASSVKHRFQMFSLHLEPGFLGAPCAFVGGSPGHFRTKGDGAALETTRGHGTARATDVTPYALFLNKQGPAPVFWSSFFWLLKLN